MDLNRHTVIFYRQIGDAASTTEEFYGEALKKRAVINKVQAAGLLGINTPFFRKALRERFGEDPV